MLGHAEFFQSACRTFVHETCIICITCQLLLSFKVIVSLSIPDVCNRKMHQQKHREAAHCVEKHIFFQKFNFDKMLLFNLFEFLGLNLNILLNFKSSIVCIFEFSCLNSRFFNLKLHLKYDKLVFLTKFQLKNLGYISFKNNLFWHSNPH